MNRPRLRCAICATEDVLSRRPVRGPELRSSTASYAHPPRRTSPPGVSPGGSCTGEWRIWGRLGGRRKTGAGTGRVAVRVAQYSFNTSIMMSVALSAYSRGMVSGGMKRKTLP